MRHASVFAGLVLVAACGGGGKNPAGPNNPNPGANGAGTMSATIDGSAWTAIGVSASKANGILIVSGSDVARTLGVSFQLSKTGTQTIGPASVALGIVIIGGQSWQANPNGTGSGSVNVTTLTANHAVGTFSFTAVATPGSTPASRQITNGKFDVKF